MEKSRVQWKALGKRQVLGTRHNDNKTARCDTSCLIWRCIENQRKHAHAIPQWNQTRLLTTVLKGYCFRGQIHSIPGYWSIPQYFWSNLFQFSSCRGSKNCYCFQHEDSNIYYCFHRNYCVTVFLSIGQYSSYS